MLQSVLDGTAVPDYKSAQVPNPPTDDGVTVVVGKNFDEIVLDETKDVLLEVGAPVVQPKSRETLTSITVCHRARHRCIHSLR